MTWYGLSVFSLAYVLAVATPGPGVAAVIARSLGHGLRGAPAKPIESTPQEVATERPVRLFLGSLALTLGNPKTMIFFLAVLPTVVELKSLSVTGFFEIALLILLILPAVLGGYAFGASRARRLFCRPESVRWVQRGTGVAMASAAVAVATR